MNPHEVDRIASAMNRLRPDWPTAQIKTLLNDERIADRPRRDVCVALAWVACDSGSHNPYRVLEAGPWWRAAGVEGTSGGSVAAKFDNRTCCSVCSLPEAKCRARWRDDHEYEPAVHAVARKGQVDVHRTVAALKAEVVPVAPPPEPKSLAERVAELPRDERMERLRAGLRESEASRPTDETTERESA